MTVKQTVKGMAQLPMLGRWMSTLLLVVLALGARLVGGRSTDWRWMCNLISQISLRRLD